MAHIHFCETPIAWGKENELKARSKYVEHMRSNGHTGLTASDSGLLCTMRNAGLVLLLMLGSLILQCRT